MQRIRNFLATLLSACSGASVAARTRLVAIGSVLLIQAAASVAAAPLPLALVRDIPLPGGTSRFDYQSLDAQSGKLFIAHLGASELLVFDTQVQRITGRVDHLDHVHGVLAVPALKRIYASATGSNEIVEIDESGLQLVSRIPGGDYPDGLAYAAGAHKLFVSDELGHTLTVITVGNNPHSSTIEMGGEVGNNQYDPESRHIFANVQTRGQLLEVNAETNEIVRRHALPGCESNHGLLIVPERKLAFIACEGNAKLLTFDMQGMQVIHEDSVGQAPDVLAYDAELERLYVASESGVVSTFQVSASGPKKMGEAWLASRAHSILVDPRTHLVYLPLENVKGHPVLRIMKPS